MRILLLTLSGMLTIHVAFGQKNITNTRTDKHQQVAGTKVALIPPADFTPSTTFPGFQQTDKASSLMVIEAPGPFREVSQAFTPEGLKTKQMVQITREDITINEKKGILLKTEQQAHGITYTKYVLLFGDDEGSIMINGTFPKQLPTLEAPVKEALLSVFHDGALVVDPLASAPFAIDVQGTKLKFAASTAGALLFTPDGKVPSLSADQTMFTAGRALGNYHAVDKKQAAITRLKQLPLENIQFNDSQIKEIEIDGLTGYAIVVEANDKTSTTNDAVVVYQAMLFTDNSYFLLLGKANKDYDTNVALFQKIAATFKQK